MDKSRQQFEDWFAPQKEEMKRNGLGMISITRMHQRQLSAWQASRESLEIELPEHPDKSDPFYDNFDLGVSLGIDQVKKVLTANGVKVKDGN